MPLEFWSTLAAIGTFVVISATAVAALVQLRHLRAGNQISAFVAMVQMYESPELKEPLHFVNADLANRLEDPAFRAGLRTRPVQSTGSVIRK